MFEQDIRCSGLNIMSSVVPLFPYEVNCCLRSHFAKKFLFTRSERSQEPADEIVPRLKMVQMMSQPSEEEIPNFRGKHTVDEQMIPCFIVGSA